MVEVNPIKETFLLGSLNIALPTVDVYSDIALASKLYYYGHPNWASILLGPFLVNYTFAWIAWFTTEKKKKLNLDRRPPWLLPSACCRQDHLALLDSAVEGSEGEEKL